MADNSISSRWKLYTAGGHFLQPMVFYSVQGICPRTLAFFSEKQSSENRGSNGMVRTFQTRRVRACITRASRGGGCGHLSSFGILSVN
ncbi:hypothetical protein HYC85_029068 [Camellia sinensis]|uniref:Uncharacterized protein n=1 Tax=Camellia sinensis TaxID=4442 RepID=A0A7J7FXM1_CAMSI|nr:hypothetical protein HYC85_029068 [Camellia sinensis]